MNLKRAALSSDLFEQELALEERLDAMVDRAVKRLVQAKAMKQMLDQTNPDRSDGLPRNGIARRLPSNDPARRN